MKDGDRIVIAYDLMAYTRKYWPLDKVANRVRMGGILGDCLCEDPKILFPKVYYTAELKWSEN